jgi:hypothetical protein
MNAGNRALLTCCLWCAVQNMEVAYEAASMLCRHLMNPRLRRYDQAAAVIQACHQFIDKLRERQTRFHDEGCVGRLASLAPAA